MIEAFFVTLLYVFASEVVGATEMVIFGLATKYKRAMPVFLGAFSAHAIHAAVAVFIGVYFGSYLPYGFIVKTGAVVFILLGILILARKKEQHKATIPHAFFATFALVAMHEFGDKTQIASLLFGATYRAFLPVFLGALAGLFFAILLNVYAARYLSKKVPANWVRVISALMFIGYGTATYFWYVI